jgi:hypothetical protein
MRRPKVWILFGRTPLRAKGKSNGPIHVTRNEKFIRSVGVHFYSNYDLMHMKRTEMRKKCTIETYSTFLMVPNQRTSSLDAFLLNTPRHTQSTSSLTPMPATNARQKSIGQALLSVFLKDSNPIPYSFFPYIHYCKARVTHHTSKGTEVANLFPSSVPPRSSFAPIRP